MKAISNVPVTINGSQAGDGNKQMRLYLTHIYKMIEGKNGRAWAVALWLVVKRLTFSLAFRTRNDHYDDISRCKLMSVGYQSIVIVTLHREKTKP